MKWTWIKWNWDEVEMKLKWTWNEMSLKLNEIEMTSNELEMKWTNIKINILPKCGS